ncbi:MAG: cyclase family protein [Elusimicrobiota bacterium]|jgi:kynurenine formamidase|nr:cyclase family protein [Elusimicrobiota bacterium]
MKKKVLLFAVILFASLTTGNIFAQQKSWDLWNLIDNLKSNYDWTDLSFEISPETPHWYGFDPLVIEEKYTFESSKSSPKGTDGVFLAYLYTLPGQYGTHTDFPGHFDPNGRLIDSYGVKDLAYKLIVIDKSKAVSKNANYQLTKKDVLEFEKQYGQIPENSFVAFRSDWSKRKASEYENKDKKGNPHYPGWALDALEYLIKERNVAVIGHETPDTDSAITGGDTMPAENYVLDNGKLNVELLKNLDKVPPVGAIVFVTFPNIKGGTGFTSRVFAISPKK